MSSDAATLPPGPPWPGWVNLIATWTRPAGILLRNRARYGKTFSAKLPYRGRFVYLSDPEDIKALFLLDATVVHPGEGTRVIEPVVGPFSLLILDEDLHLEHRRLLLPAFHGERMAGLAALMAQLTAAELDTWPTDGSPAPLHPRLQRLTLEIILRAVFGLEQGPLLDRFRSTILEVIAFAENPISIVPALQRYLRWTDTQQRFETTMAATDALIEEIVAARRAALADDPAGAEGASDVLAMLLAARHEDGSEMSPREIRHELITAVVAGHETTASQLAWLFMRLAREPGVRARLTAELDATAGQGGPYLQATLQEIQRLHPVVANAEPRIVKSPVTVGRYTYPPGVSLLASNLLSGRDPDLWPEPSRFDPGRFLDADGAVIKPGTYTWTPFGGGRRRCIGAAFAQQEMRIVAAAVLHRFELEAPSPRLERARRRAITLSPVLGATVCVTPRRNANRDGAEATTVGITPANGSARAAQAL